MAARNRKNQVVSGLAITQGPVPTSQFDGETTDEAALLIAFDSHLQLLENRPKTTADTYRSHVKGFLRYFATAHPSVALKDVTKLQVRVWLFHEASRGLAPRYPREQTVCSP